MVVQVVAKRLITEAVHSKVMLYGFFESNKKKWDLGVVTESVLMFDIGSQERRLIM